MRDAGILDGDLLAVHRTRESAFGADRRGAPARRSHGQALSARAASSPAASPENPDFKPIAVDLKREALRHRRRRRRRHPQRAASVNEHADELAFVPSTHALRSLIPSCNIPPSGAAATARASPFPACRRDSPSSTHSCRAAAGPRARSPRSTPSAPASARCSSPCLPPRGSRRPGAGSRWSHRRTCRMRPRSRRTACSSSRLLLVRPGDGRRQPVGVRAGAARAACAAPCSLWQDHIHERALRRLQLAAESGGASLFCSARRASRPLHRRR